MLFEEYVKNEHEKEKQNSIENEKTNLEWEDPLNPNINLARRFTFSSATLSICPSFLSFEIL